MADMPELDSPRITKTTPDPSDATNDAIKRAAVAERDYVDGQFAILVERLRGMDEAAKVLNETVTRTPTDIQKEVSHLRELDEEKFESVGTQFKERDTRSERECLSADELILCADLIWRPAGELGVGDELVGLDEEPLPGRKGRCYRRAVVTANSLKPDRLLQVNTSRGSVRCNAQHPWLVRDSTLGRRWHWVKTCDLHVGSEVMNVLDVWQVDNSYEAGWFAGILDGEGWLGSKNLQESPHGGARIIIGQVLGLIDDEIGLAFKKLSIPVQRYSRASVGKARAQSRWQVDSRPAIMRLLGSLRPKRLLTKANAVWEGHTLFGKSRSNVAAVISIEDVGMGTIAMLSTSTGTYIGAGFAHHNSRGNKVAVDAAFAAQKEAAAKQDEGNQKAIDKSEKSTAETINKLSDLFRTTIEGLAGNLSDLKTRIERIESGKQGGENTVAKIYAAIVAVGALLAIIVILANLVFK